jgi:hypothetical protein
LTVEPLGALPVKDEPIHRVPASRSLPDPVERTRPKMAVAQSSDSHCSARTAKSTDGSGTHKSTRPHKSNDCKPAAGAPSNAKAGVPGQRKPSTPVTTKHDARISAQPVATPHATSGTSGRHPQDPALS